MLEEILEMQHAGKRAALARDLEEHRGRNGTFRPDCAGHGSCCSFQIFTCVMVTRCNEGSVTE